MQEKLEIGFYYWLSLFFSFFLENISQMPMEGLESEFFVFHNLVKVKIILEQR